MPRISLIALATLGTLVIACSGTPEPRNVAATSACSQLKDTKPVLETFYAPGAVHSVREVKETVFLARALQPERTMGAELYVHAPPNVSEGYMRRVLACHSTLGTAAHPNDPLHPAEGPITELGVRTVGDSLAVRVVGEDARTGREIYRRAKALSRGSVTVEQLASAQSSGTNL